MTDSHAQPTSASAIPPPINGKPSRSNAYSATHEYGSALLDVGARELSLTLEQEAVRLASESLRSFPDAPSRDQAFMRLADAQFREDSYEAAYRSLDSLAISCPNSPLLAHAHYVRAERLLEQKRYAAAHEAFAHATLQAQDDAVRRSAKESNSEYSRIAAHALFWDGVSLLFARKTAEAQPRLLLCAELYPHNQYADDALLLCARHAEQQGNTDKALEYYARTVREYPTCNTRLAAHLRMAQNYLLQRQPNDALAQVVAIEEVSNSPSRFEPQLYADNAAEQALYIRGEANNMKASYDEALKAFTALLNNYPPTPQNAPLRLRARLGAGYALLNLGKPDEALKEYDAVIDADLSGQAATAFHSDEARLPATARLYHAVSLKRKGDTASRDAARRELNGLAMRSDFPYTPQALVELGQMQYEDGKMDEARKTLERAAREAQDAPTQVRAQLLLGEVSLDAGFTTIALRAFEKAQSLAEHTSTRELPNRGLYLVETALKRGVTLVAAKRATEAIAALTKFLNQYPDADGRAEAAFWLAEAYFQADLLKNAEQAYQMFVKTYGDATPDSPRVEEAWYGLGWAQFRTRQFTESATTFTRMLREFPQSRYALDVLTRKGDGHYLTKQYKPAADAYRQASRLNPKSEQGEYAAFQLGQCLYRLQEFEQAVNEMETFAKRYPNSRLADDAAYLVGWIHFQQRRFADAVTQFKILADTYPDGSATARGFYAMGDAQFNLGVYDDALKSYQTVADRYPASPLAADAVNAMQYCLTLLGREQEAVATADKYIAANPNSPFSHDVKFKKAELFFNGRKFQSAIAEYENFLATSPQSERAAEAMVLLGRSYAGAGDSTSIKRAFEVFARVQERYPQSPFAAAAALEAGLVRLEQTDGRRFEDADTLFARTLQRYPQSDAAIRAAFERASLREQRGDTVAAIALYGDVAERYKGSDYGDRCRFRVATWFRKQGQFDSARAQFEPLTERTDELGAESQYRVGELFQREKNFEKAIEAFTKSKTKFADVEDWYSLALLNLGYCNEQLKRYEAAKEAYRLVLVARKNDKEDDFVRAAQQSLDRLMKM